MEKLKNLFSGLPTSSESDGTGERMHGETPECTSLPSSNEVKPFENSELVKRRAQMPVFLFDRPLLTQVEFIVDVRYHSLKVIGAGSFGVVASAIDSTTSERVAIKKILSAFSSSKIARRVLREVRLLRHLSHPHIVRFLDIDLPHHYRSWNEVYITTPLLKMDLHTALKQGFVNTPQLQKKIAFQMLTALEHMHSLGLMHRDVKSRNIVLDDKLNLQLCDLGHARFYSKVNRLDDSANTGDDDTDDKFEPGLTVNCTTIVQSPPEIALNLQYDAMVDIWAAGCVIAQIIQTNHEGLFDSTGKNGHLSEILKLVGQLTDSELEALPIHARWMVKRHLKGTGARRRDRPLQTSPLRSKLGKGADPLAIDLVEKMLQFLPFRRLSAREALKHQWFDQVRKEDLVQKESYKFRDSEANRGASRAQIKKMVWDEVVAFHPETVAMGIH